MEDFLSKSFLANTALDWALALVVTVFVWIAVRILVRILLSRMRVLAAKTETDVDDLVTELLDKTKVFFVALVALYAGARSLEFSGGVDSVLTRIVIIGFLIQGAFWADGIVNYILGSWAQKKFKDDPTVATAMGSVRFLIRLGVWSTFVMLALDNLGIDIGPLVASLGIGGLALGLALQGTLSDLYASFSIIFDKPFAVGDFIQVGSLAGTVQHVGLKTTRVTALTGEQLIFSNSDLLGSRIQNLQRRDERRCSFILGVTYDTDPDQLERIPDFIKEIIENKDCTRFDRCFFMAFGDSALNFEVVYYMLDPDYLLYAATNHSINLDIFRKFNEEGVEFAYPTQTIHMQSLDEKTEG